MEIFLAFLLWVLISVLVAIAVGTVIRSGSSRYHDVDRHFPQSSGRTVTSTGSAEPVALCHRRYTG
jgi:hypothetical protein